MAIYDTIGRGYGNVRRPDPRIAAMIREALADARTVINVGAGTGSYEPPDLDVASHRSNCLAYRFHYSDLEPIAMGPAYRGSILFLGDAR